MKTINKAYRSYRLFITLIFPFVTSLHHIIYHFTSPSEFTFLYNQLGPIPANSLAQQKHLIKQIGQGLALVEFSPLNVKRPANAFPVLCSISPSRTTGGVGGNINNTRNDKRESNDFHNQSSVPLILSSGSQTALEKDMIALRYHLDTNKKFSLHPSLPSSISNFSAESSPVPSNIASGGRQSIEKTFSVDINSELLPTSVSELQLKIYPTIPMQTQLLADFCIACFEKALTVYSVERLMSASGNGISATSFNSTSSLPSPSIYNAEKAVGTSQVHGNEIKDNSSIPIPLGTNASMNPTQSIKTLPILTDSKPTKIVEYPLILENKEGKVQDEYTSGRNSPQKPLFADFLRLKHNALGAASSSSLFLTRGSGILHIPFILPKHKAYMIRALVIEKILEAYPILRNSAMESSCDPLFLERVGTGLIEEPLLSGGKSDAGCGKGSITKNEDNISCPSRRKNGKSTDILSGVITPVQWCEIPSITTAKDMNSIIFGSSNSSSPTSTSFSTSVSPTILSKRAGSFNTKLTEQEDSTVSVNLSTTMIQSTSQDIKERTKTGDHDKSRDRNTSSTPPYVVSSSSPFSSPFSSYCFLSRNCHGWWRASITGRL